MEIFTFLIAQPEPQIPQQAFDALTLSRKTSHGYQQDGAEKQLDK